MNKFALLALLLVTTHVSIPRALANEAAEPGGIQWVGWTDDLFERATKEKKLVVLDLEAIWCHWCHVMEKETYSKPEVRELMAKGYIAVKVDQDGRPDLSRRYEDYGWPATIFFDSKGRELAKRSGFIEPEEMTALLKKLSKNPVPEEKTGSQKEQVAKNPFLSDKQRKELLALHVNHYDPKDKGWGTVHKFLFGETEEYAMRLAWRPTAPGKAEQEGKASGTRAKDTLTAALAIIDPAWGGIYQYSVDAWIEPHFEKIAQKQSDALFLYSLGYGLFQDEKLKKGAADIRRYLEGFLLSPEGAFYTSQDADLIQGVHSDGYFKLSDAERRKQGIPRIDKNMYARENGLFIQALAFHYMMTGDADSLKLAMRAADWVVAHRSLPDGGFKHGENDPSGPYLSDSLEMTAAFIRLYEATADRKWIPLAEKTAQFVAAKFPSANGAGFITAVAPAKSALAPLVTRDENVRAARVFSSLFHYTGKQEFKDRSLSAMKAIAAPKVARELPTGGVLLADEEATRDPVHLTIVGGKSDPKAKALFQAALSYPTSFKRVEWWDQSEGQLPRMDVTYPQLKTAAAFACSGGRCSTPITDPAKLHEKVTKIYTP